MSRIVITISIIALVALPFSGIFTRSAHALDGGAGYVLVNKEYVLDPVARALARSILTAVTDEIGRILTEGTKEYTTWDDGPSWITFYDYYSKIEQDSGRERVGKMFDEALFDENKGTICEHLVEQLANVLPTMPRNSIEIEFFDLSFHARIDTTVDFRHRVECSLPETILIDGAERAVTPELIAEFEEDFSVGGWELFELLNRPENNFLGVYNAALEEYRTQVIRAEEDAINEVIAGGGFVGTRDIHGRIATPGSVLAMTAGNIIKSELDWLSGADELEEVLFSAIGVLTSRVAGFIDSQAFIDENPDLAREKIPSTLAEENIDMFKTYCQQSAAALCDNENVLSTCAWTENSAGNEDPGTGATSETTSGSNQCSEMSDDEKKATCMTSRIPQCLAPLIDVPIDQIFAVCVHIVGDNPVCVISTPLD